MSENQEEIVEIKKYKDWMESDSDENESNLNFDRKDKDLFDQERFEGLEGHMRLQMQKTFGGDERFKLTEDFDISLKDANKTKSHISDVMLGALSKREHQDFMQKMKEQKKVKSLKKQTDDDQSEYAWDHAINLEKEQGNALRILSQIVPANEIFLTSSKSSNASNLKQLFHNRVESSEQARQIDELLGKGDSAGTKKRAMHIQRYDPSNPKSFALIVQSQDNIKKVDSVKKEKNEDEIKRQLHEQGRLQVLNQRNKNNEKNNLSIQERKEALQAEFNEILQHEENQKDRVIQIEGKTWQSIINERKVKDQKYEQKVISNNQGNQFVLSFGDEEQPKENKIFKQKIVNQKQENQYSEKSKDYFEQDQKKEIQKKEIDKKEEKKEKQKKKKQQEKQEDRKLAWDELPNRIQKRIEKRNRKKKELRQQMKLQKLEKLNLSTSTEQELLQKYKMIYQEKTEDQLKEYIHFQKLIQQKKQKKSGN